MRANIAEANFGWADRVVTLRPAKNARTEQMIGGIRGLKRAFRPPRPQGGDAAEPLCLVQGKTQGNGKNQAEQNCPAFAFPGGQQQSFVAESTSRLDWSNMRIQASEAKTHLPELLDKVEQGLTIVITRHGRAIARLVPEANSAAGRRWTEALEEDRRIAETHREHFPQKSFYAVARHEGHKY